MFTKKYKKFRYVILPQVNMTGEHNVDSRILSDYSGLLVKVEKCEVVFEEQTAYKLNKDLHIIVEGRKEPIKTDSEWVFEDETEALKQKNRINDRTFTDLATRAANTEKELKELKSKIEKILKL